MIEIPDFACPMPVVRRFWTDEKHDEFVDRLEPCGEVVALHDVTVSALNELGEPCYEFDGPGWELECNGGHVLLVPDDEGNGYGMEYAPEFGRAVGRITWEAS